MSSASRLDQSELLNEPVHADELQELLARLAATDALFAEPVPTIRDVAEATDASPLLIGRILSQMRGPDEVAELKGRMDGFEARLRELEIVQKIPEEGLRNLLLEAGTADFRPLSDQVIVPADQSELDSSVMVVSILAILLIFSLVGAFRFYSSIPRLENDRPFQFPMERSTR